MKVKGSKGVFEKSSASSRILIGLHQPKEVRLRGRLQIRHQQAQNVLSASKECGLGVLVFQGVSGVFGKFKAQPPGEHHHHLGGAHLSAFSLDVQVTRMGQALQEGAKGAGFVKQDVLGFLLKPAVPAEEVTKVSVQETVLPNQLKQGVHEKPSLLHIAGMGGCGQKGMELVLKIVKERIDQFVFGGKVVVKVAWADVELRGDQGGGNIGLTKAIEKPKRRFKYSLCRSSRSFFNHD